MKTLKRSLLAAAALVAMGTQANAASGSTSVSFNFPNIIVLHYYSSVQFSINPGAFDFARDQGGFVGTATTTTPGVLTLNANIAPSDDASTDFANYTATIQNAWAVRGITATGNIGVTITLDQANATNGTSTVTIKPNPTVSVGANSGTTITIAAPGLALGNAVLGDVNMGVDISGVTTPGLHSGAQYTITAAEI